MIQLQVTWSKQPQFFVAFGRKDITFSHNVYHYFKFLSSKYNFSLYIIILFIVFHVPTNIFFGFIGIPSLHFGSRIHLSHLCKQIKFALTEQNLLETLCRCLLLFALSENSMIQKEFELNRYFLYPEKWIRNYKIDSRWIVRIISEIFLYSRSHSDMYFDESLSPRFPRRSRTASFHDLSCHFLDSCYSWSYSP